MENVLETVMALGAMYLPRIITAILIFVIGRWVVNRVTRIVVRLLQANNVEQTLVNFLNNIVYYALLTAVIIAALNQIGINTTSFLAILGAAGLAIGLALKDSLSNFSSGVMLILFRPFKIGDFVEIAGVNGTVKAIAIFYTELATGDNQKIIIPNSSVMGNVIKNVTANDTRRIDIVMGIGYSDDIDAAKKVIEGVLAGESRLLSSPAPQIAVSELADSSVNFVVRPWVKTADYWGVRFALLEEMKKRFDQEGISIPYPQQDVHLYQESGE